MKKMGKNYFLGKNAVITGSASGIGREFALQLAELGTNLVLSDINMERLEQIKEKTEEYGVKVIALKCDVTDQSNAQNLAATAISEMKIIHFLFSNAGIAAGGRYEWYSYDEWDRIIKINIWGMIYIVNAFLPYILEQKFGHIIITSSIAGSIGVGGLIPYSTTKFANAGFCEALYAEFHHRGIEVSIVCPFPLKTNLIETVAISMPPNFFEGVASNDAKKAIEVGKRYFWEEFTKKQSIMKGYGGGLEIKHAVKDYLNQISRKKLYIFDRRYGRLLQFFKGFHRGIYQYFLTKMGDKSTELVERAFRASIQSLDPKVITKARAAGNRYMDIYSA
jgi:short-subunit dehydrogenase